MWYRKCAYNNCDNIGPHISMFRFPFRDQDRLKVWIQNSGNPSLNLLTSEELGRRYVCAAHFPRSRINRTLLRSRLIGPAIPIHFQSANIVEGTSTQTSPQRDTEIGNVALTELPLETKNRYISDAHFEKSNVKCYYPRKRIEKDATPHSFKDKTEILEDSTRELKVKSPEKVHRKQSQLTAQDAISRTCLQQEKSNLEEHQTVIDQILEPSPDANLLPQNEIYSWQKPIEAVLESEDDDITEKIDDNLSLYCEDENDQRPTVFKRDSKTREDHLHHEYVCNFCKEPVTRFRYRCVQCADCDLCARCEAGGYHPEHYVLRIPQDRPQAEVQSVLLRIRSQLLGGDKPLLAGDISKNLLPNGVKVEVKEEEEQCEPDPLWVEGAQPRAESVECARPHHGDADPGLSVVAIDIQEHSLPLLNTLSSFYRRQSESSLKCGEDGLYERPRMSDPLRPNVLPVSCLNTRLRKKKPNVTEISSCPIKQILKDFNDDDSDKEEEHQIPTAQASLTLNKLSKRQRNETYASPSSSEKHLQDFGDNEIDDKTWVPEPSMDIDPILVSNTPTSLTKRKENEMDASHSSQRQSKNHVEVCLSEPVINKSLSPPVFTTRTMASPKQDEKEISSTKRQCTEEPSSSSTLKPQPPIRCSLLYSQDNYNLINQSKITKHSERTQSFKVRSGSGLVIPPKLFNQMLLQQPTVKLRTLSIEEINSKTKRSDVERVLTNTRQKTSQQTVGFPQNMKLQQLTRPPKLKVYQAKHHRSNNNKI